MFGAFLQPRTPTHTHYTKTPSNILKVEALTLGVLLLSGAQDFQHVDGPENQGKVCDGNGPGVCWGCAAGVLQDRSWVFCVCVVSELRVLHACGL